MQEVADWVERVPPLMVHPVVVGGGKRLFRDRSDMTVLRLVDTKTLSSGRVVLSYEPDKRVSK